MPVLTVVDTTGTQRYIFSSNRLRESIGASEIVARATSCWVFEVLRETFGVEKTNLKTAQQSRRSPFDEIDNNKAIEDSSGNIVLDTEVIYAGGGNTLILFASRNKAKHFALRYTKLLLERAPGLDVVIAHSQDFGIADKDEEETVDESGEVDDFGNFIKKTIQRSAILRVLDETMKKVNQKKANRRLPAPLLGMAVSAQCVSTGGVATHDPLDLATNNKLRRSLQEKYRGGYVSAETFAKLQMAQKASERLKSESFSGIDLNGLQIPRELDDLGRTRDEASFVAIVHTDGNRMGERMKAARDGTTNRECVEKMRRFSKSIYEANLVALKEMLRLLRAHIEPGASGSWDLKSPNDQSFSLSQNAERDETFFPLRPLIFGGDDLTFICDGRLALALTAFYLDALETRAPKLSDHKPLYARAGVSIVKSHYPFRRAYNLAEKLAQSAKDRINEIDEDNKQVAALDWHVAMTGLAGDVGEIREHEYTVKQGSLNMRPISLRAKDQTDWRTWQGFAQVIKEFQEGWKDRRNKVKALREALRGGKDKTEEFLKLHPSNKLPPMPNCDGMKAEGWHSNRCGYFDAIEMVDLFFSLDETELKQAPDKAHTIGGAAE